MPVVAVHAQYGFMQSYMPPIINMYNEWLFAFAMHTFISYITHIYYACSLMYKCYISDHQTQLQHSNSTNFRVLPVALYFPYSQAARRQENREGMLQSLLLGTSLKMSTLMITSLILLSPMLDAVGKPKFCHMHDFPCIASIFIIPLFLFILVM